MGRPQQRGACLTWYGGPFDDDTDAAVDRLDNLLGR